MIAARIYENNSLDLCEEGFKRQIKLGNKLEIINRLLNMNLHKINQIWDIIELAFRNLI